MSDVKTAADAKAFFAEAAAFLSEVRQFSSRLMTGYEASQRMLAAHCEMLGDRLEKSEAATTRALELQVRLAEEREDLVSLRHRRELESAEAKSRQENADALTRDLRTIAPLAIKKWLGIPLTGNDSHGLQDLLATMTPDQMEAATTTGEIKLTVAQRQLLTATLGSLAGAPKEENPEPEPQAAE